MRIALGRSSFIHFGSPQFALITELFEPFMFASPKRAWMATCPDAGARSCE